MNALAANYAALLSEMRPEVIRDEKQNQAYVRQLEKLTSKKSVTLAEEKLIDLLAVLIEDFEAKQFPVPGSDARSDRSASDGGPRIAAEGPDEHLRYGEHRLRSPARQT